MTSLKFSLVSLLLISQMALAETAIPNRPDDIRPLLVGQSIPLVKVRTTDGKEIGLREIVGQKPTVLVFYRGGWCPFCNTQLKDLKELEPKLEEIGVQLIALSADRPEGLKESIKKHEIRYRLYSDASAAAAKGFGIAFKVNKPTLEMYKGFGVSLEQASGEKHHLLPVPAVFLVGPEGEIKFEYVNPDYKVRLKSEILMSAAQAVIGTKK